MIHAVLLPAIFCILRARLAALTVRNGHYPVSAHAGVHQEFLGGIRAALAQAEVILFAPALVTLAFDGEFHPLMLLQVARIAGKGGFRVGTDGSFVIVKESVFDVLVELLILADFLDRRCRWRRWRWDRHGHAGGGTLRAAWTRGGQGVGG